MLHARRGFLHLNVMRGGMSVVVEPAVGMLEGQEI